MASFTERYHTLTKYNPGTIDKLESVHWDESPVPFKPIGQNDKIPLKSFLNLGNETEQPSLSAVFPGENESLNLKALAHLLYFTAGITSKIETPGGDYYLRANPSAGALYPTEIYLAVRGMSDLEDGVYYYHPLLSELQPIRQGNVIAKLEKSLNVQGGLEGSNLQLFFTGIFARSAWRYKERAYRRILLDTGHALGNVLEICKLMKKQPYLWAGFIDDQVEDLLKLEPKKETPLASIIFKNSPDDTPLFYQPASLPPVEAVKNVDREDPIQIQQNTCERIITPPEPVVIENVQKAARKDVADKIPDLLKVILNRRSCREFSGGSVSMAEAQNILDFAYQPLPSGTGLFSANFLKSYVISHKIENQEAGIYQFSDPSMEWDMIQSGNFTEEALDMSLGQPLSRDCSFLLVHAVDLPALVNQYGDRGYRYICLDAGVIGQRINLLCNSLNIGSSGIGGYFDDMVNQTLQLPLNYAIIYITVVGKPLLS